MSLFDRRYSLKHEANPLSVRGDYGSRQEKVLDGEGTGLACRELQGWDGYRVTPIHSLEGIAKAVGVRDIWYKDEASRFGLGSFKALGGAYAVARVLIRHIEDRTGESGLTTRELHQDRLRDLIQEVTVTCATDGNHGRSVAWGAQLFGCKCVIYIHETVSKGREEAIAAYGATVIRTKGNYDDAVRQAELDAGSSGRVVVSDTSYPGYMTIPGHVMEGYVLMAREAMEQLPYEIPSHIFIPGGVGGFAAAVGAAYWMRFGAKRPTLIVVEPDNAACIHDSVAAGKPTAVKGDLETIMAGLACGEVSLLAWELLEECLDHALVIPDEVAAECMKILAKGKFGDPPVVAGESAVAGLAGLLVAKDYPDIWDSMGLGEDSRVLLFGSEGATDPETYARIVGENPKV